MSRAAGEPGPTTLRLVLARHGQTPANVGRVLDTRLPGPGLTDLGREQARALGRELADGAEGPVVAVYHSSAHRAAETAALVAAGLGLVPQRVEGVHEVQVGELEGRHDEESITRFRAVYDGWLGGRLEDAIDGGESGRDVVTRYLAAVSGLRERHADGGTIVLISHGGALRLAAQTLVEGVGTPAPGTQHADQYSTPTGEHHVQNCGRVALVPHGEGWELAAWRGQVPGGLPPSDDVTG